VSEAREDLSRALHFFQSVDERFESKRVERLLTAADQQNAVWDIRNDSADFPINDHTNISCEPQLTDRGTDDTVDPSGATNPVQTGSHRIHHPSFPRILGISAVLYETLELLKRCAPSNSPVLIEGETGTGKELLARAIHDLSPRAKRPFIPFNCGTSTPDVFDAEICGYVRGAFTGAVNSRAGLVRAAEGGTLFLDEVAELTHAIQPRLLRLLDIGEIRPVGSDEVLRSDVRVVAATHQNMDEAVEAKRFRPDLFYRLCTFRVKVPALRERLDDLPLLVQHFVNEARMNGYPDFVGVSSTVIGKMARYAWPGNIRELRNEVLRLAQRSTPGEKVKHWHTPESPVSPESGEPIGAYLWERERIIRELAAGHGSVATVARRLGISRARVYRLITHWEIDLGSFRSK
jgi:transcriptional regulator with PAS, ATPase and Fis domain